MQHVSAISTIGIRRDTRDLLKKLGKKGDTYDELIRRLVKNSKGSLDGGFATLQSSESHST
jgi:predicted CopG family antitoxin